MKTTIQFLFLILIMISFACKPANQEEKPIIEKENTQEDSIISIIQQDTSKKQHEIEEQKENLAKIEKKHGEQWGFCECVVANDSIDKAVKRMTDFETPEAEKLLARFEYVSNKCQAFLGMDANRTPDQRAKHEKRVKQCLKNVKS